MQKNDSDGRKEQSQDSHSHAFLDRKGSWCLIQKGNQEALRKKDQTSCPQDKPASLPSLAWLRVLPETVTMEISTEVPQRTEHGIHVTQVDHSPEHLKDPKSTINKDICISMFIATVHSCQEMGQPRWPSVDEWRKRF